MGVSSRRIFFLDPSLGRSGGHHAVVAANYARLLSDAGRPVIFVGNRLAKDVTGFEHFVPAFNYGVEDVFRVTLHGAAWLADRNIVRAARAIAPLAGVRRAFARGEMSPRKTAPLDVAACHALLKPFNAMAVLDRLQAEFSLTKDDDVVFLSAEPALLAAVSARAEKWLGSSADAPRLHILFMYPEDRVFGPATMPGFLQIYRTIFDADPPTPLYAESAFHAADLARIAGREIAFQTTPVRISSSPRPDGPFTVSALGAARADKGYLVLPDIIAAVHAAAPDIAFRVQAPEPGAGLEKATRRLKSEPAVTLLPERLTESQYEVELARAHAIVLPYDEIAFARRGSGVVVDAAIAGRPFVCTRGTALETSIEGQNGLAASGAAEFAAAIVRIRTEYDAFLTAASTYSAKAVLQMRRGPLVSALRLDSNF